MGQGGAKGRIKDELRGLGIGRGRTQPQGGTQKRKGVRRGEREQFELHAAAEIRRRLAAIPTPALSIT